MDIKNDTSIMSICRTCEKCSNIYEVATDSQLLSEVAVCGICQLESRGAEKNTRKKLKTLPSSGYSSLLPYQIPQVKETLEITFGLGIVPPRTIIDASAHIGGDTINFAKLWPECKITSVDIDEKAIECLKINVANLVANSANIEIVCADCTKWIRSEHRIADFYYFDPPWGGPNYSSEDEISLFFSGEPVTQIIKFVLGVGSSEPSLAPKVILKAPKNFAYHEFKKEVAPAQTRIHYIRKPQRRGTIAYALILIWV